MKLSHLWRRLRFRAGRNQMDADLRSEMQQHIELLTADLIAQDKSPEEARLIALRRFGNPRSLREESRDSWGFPSLESIVQDLRFGARLLARSPGFTFIAVVTLALGIAATATLFSVLNTVLLRSLPYPEPQRLVSLAESNATQHIDREEVSLPNYLDWQTRARSFESLAAYTTDSGTLRIAGAEPLLIDVAYVSATLFQTLQSRPALGRLFNPSDDHPNQQTPVILSARLWRERFASDQEIIGRAIKIGGDTFTIIGVMPAGWQFPNDESRAWLPLGALEGGLMRRRSAHVFTVIGRLKPHVTIAQAQEEMSLLATQLNAEFRGEDADHGVDLRGLQDSMVGSSRPILLVMFGAVALLLVIACTNVANLLLSRATARQKEIAMRLALGAKRMRLVRQFVVENLTLAVLAAALGLALAMAAVVPARERLQSLLPRAAEIAVDWHVLLFTAAVSLATAVFFGVAPAVYLGRFAPRNALTEGYGNSGSRARRHMARALAATELTLALVLLSGAGLMFNSLWRVMHVPLGFNAQRTLTASVALPGLKYSGVRQAVQFYDSLIARLESLPGVEQASAASALPLNGGDANGDLTIEGQPFATGAAPPASYRRVLPNYFHTMAIARVVGRDFNAQDDGRNKVVIINESAAKNYFPNEDAIGRKIKVGPAASEPWLTIVGVVADVRNAGLELAPGVQTYEPYAQRPRLTMQVVVRAAQERLALAPAIRSAVHSLEPDALVSQLGSMEQRVDESVLPRRIQAIVLGSFAGLALLLASIGLYGVLAFFVTSQRREIAIRMAVGASRREVLRHVLHQGVQLLGIALAVGVPVVLGGGRLISGLLYGLKPSDPGTLLCAVVALSAVTLLASYIPARRATAVEPLIALRSE
jgi:predicted permease